jgi:DNA-binding FrmR family transcriptional regulator
MEQDKGGYLYPFGRLERSSLEVDRLFHTDEPVTKLLERLDRIQGYLNRLIKMGNDGSRSLQADSDLIKEIHDLIVARARALVPVEEKLASIHPSLKQLMTTRLGIWDCDVKGDYNV